jgi:hypothetical protein
MDDVEAPDLSMFAPTTLIKLIEGEMKAYFR